VVEVGDGGGFGAAGEPAPQIAAAHELGEQRPDLREAFAQRDRVHQQPRRHPAGDVVGGADLGADRGPVVQAPLFAFGGPVGGVGGASRSAIATNSEAHAEFSTRANARTCSPGVRPARAVVTNSSNTHSALIAPHGTDHQPIHICG
jgi:hypothetical protein